MEGKLIFYIIFATIFIVQISLFFARDNWLQSRVDGPKFQIRCLWRKTKYKVDKNSYETYN